MMNQIDRLCLSPTKDSSFGVATSFFSLFVLLFFHFSLTVNGQGTSTDYELSATYRARTANTVFRDSVVPVWGDSAKNVDAEIQGDLFWYRVATGPGTHEYVFVNCVEGKRTLAFDHEKLAASLANFVKVEVRPQSLPLKSLRFSDSGDRWSFKAFDQNWLFDCSTSELKSSDDSAVVGSEVGLAPSHEIRRSRGGGDRVPIRFANRLKKDLEYLWVMPDGGLRSYGLVKSGQVAVMETFDGHAWLLRDSSGASVASFVAASHSMLAVIDQNTPVPRPYRSQERRPRNRTGQSPDGNWQVSVDAQNIRVRHLPSDREQTFLWSEINSDLFSDEVLPGRVWWSPSSKHFAMLPAVPGDRRQIPLIESSPEGKVHPELHWIGYAKPGDEVDHPRPLLFSFSDDWTARLIDDSMFPNPYSLSRMSWDSDGESFSFLYNERGHQCLRLITVDANNATPRICINEQSETFVCYSQKTFLHRLHSSNEWIWMSERSGWNHLYLIDADTGDVKASITSGDWVVRKVEEVDEVKREVLLTVSGIDPDQDPYHQHLVRVGFDGKRPIRLTRGDGDHQWSISPDKKWLIDTYSRVDLPPVTELRSFDSGSLVCELESADISRLLATGWKCPERFVTTGRDGETEIYGFMVRPTKFKVGDRYPVLEHIYAGPHSSFVPKRFGLHRQLYEMAELGFVVTKMDGMGTSNRSKAFHDVCWQNLADSGFPDRILWMKAAAANRPEMDLERVGIWGGSAGGQSAMRALIAHGDFYKAAVADCGCHDNRVDKIWWNEQWMGWPVGAHYRDQSNSTQAHRLSGDLMLIWGEMDRNVDPASTMQVIDALVRANKDFTQLVIPGAGHGAASHPYAKRQQFDFFVRKLWHREPRAN